MFCNYAINILQYFVLKLQSTLHVYYKLHTALHKTICHATKNTDHTTLDYRQNYEC